MFPDEQCRQALAAKGFDLGCEFLHAHQQHPDSLVYDLMELAPPWMPWCWRCWPGLHSPAMMWCRVEPGNAGCIRTWPVPRHGVFKATDVCHRGRGTGTHNSTRQGASRPYSDADFDFSYNPEIPKARLWELASGRFIEEHAAVLLCGPTGVGKSFVAQALGLQACRQQRSVLFAKTAAVLTDLAGAPTGATRRGCAATSAPRC